MSKNTCSVTPTCFKQQYLKTRFVACQMLPNWHRHWRAQEAQQALPACVSSEKNAFKHATIAAICLAPLVAIILYRLTTASQMGTSPMAPLSLASYEPLVKGHYKTGTPHGKLDESIYGPFSMNPQSETQPFNGASVALALGLITVFSFCLVL